MTLLIAFTAAVVVTVVWYSSPKARKMNIGLMCYMYWGASLMWLVDAIFEYSELGADFFCSRGFRYVKRPLSWALRSYPWTHSVDCGASCKGPR